MPREAKGKAKKRPLVTPLSDDTLSEDNDAIHIVDVAGGERVKKRKCVENVTRTQIVLEYTVNNRTGTSRRDASANLDALPLSVANEIIGMAANVPQIGRHELHHPKVVEPIIVIFEQKQVSSVGILLDFADLRRTCDLLALDLSSANAGDAGDGKGTAVILSRVITLAAMLRNESYVLSGFPPPGSAARDAAPMEHARTCLRGMCNTARQVIRVLNGGKKDDDNNDDNDDEATAAFLKQAADDLGAGITTLRINMRIDWT